MDARRATSIFRKFGIKSLDYDFKGYQENYSGYQIYDPSGPKVYLFKKLNVGPCLRLPTTLTALEIFFVGRDSYWPSRDEVVAAHYTDDKWYCAHVRSIALDGSLTLHFNDYSNTEDLDVTLTCRLQRYLPELPKHVTGVEIRGRPIVRDHHLLGKDDHVVTDGSPADDLIFAPIIVLYEEG